MKKVKEILYEKFKQETDPIEDLNIGGIDFYDEYVERYKQEENRLYTDWQEFVMQFKGKWFVGEMDRYGHGKYQPERIKGKILAKEIEMDRSGLINIKTDFATYHLLPTQRYKIVDE